MKLFIDTANLKEIKSGLEKGIIGGITTNPSLMAKEPKSDFYKHINKIVDLCEDIKQVPLSVEVFAKDAKDMYTQALDITEKINYDKLNIKIPIGLSELETINNLYNKGIDVNCTCCFSESQMELGALAGSRYISLFYNRLKDFGGNPIKVLQNTRNFLDNSDLNCEIITGSIRNTYDITDSWNAGADIVTAGYNLIPKMVSHPQTDKSVEGFLNDFKTWIK